MEGPRICQTAKKYPNQMKQSYHVSYADRVFLSLHDIFHSCPQIAHKVY